MGPFRLGIRDSETSLSCGSHSFSLSLFAFHRSIESETKRLSLSSFLSLHSHSVFFYFTLCFFALSFSATLDFSLSSFRRTKQQINHSFPSIIVPPVSDLFFLVRFPDFTFSGSAVKLCLGDLCSWFQIISEWYILL